MAGKAADLGNVAKVSAQTIATGTGTAGVPTQSSSFGSLGTTIAGLTEDIGYGRNQAKDLQEQYIALHQDSMFLEWQYQTGERGKMAPSDLLAALNDLGFAWRDVARMVGVSVAAVQKWRKGENVTGENRRRLANLLAACDLISGHYAVNEIASWFEMPLFNGISVTPMDLYLAEEYDLMFDYAGGKIGPDQALDQYEPGWRSRLTSDFQVYRSEDGNLSIGQKES